VADRRGAVAPLGTHPRAVAGSGDRGGAGRGLGRPRRSRARRGRGCRRTDHRGSQARGFRRIRAGASAASARAAGPVQSRRGQRPRRGVPTGRLPGGAGADRALAATLVLSRGVRSLRAGVHWGAPPDALRVARVGARDGLGGDREELRQFEGADGFEGPCEMVVGAGVK
jgi:hypothetical protein